MYSKNCPDCGEIISFNTKVTLNQSIKRNSSCSKCKCLRMSLKTKGIKKSEEHREKLSEAKIGIKLSETHKNNIGKSCKGLKRSEESKLKYSLSKLGEKNPNFKKDTDDYDRYRKSVDNLTNRNKKKLFNEWNGYDYYDNEYIINNLKLDYNHPMYPVVDHKISVFEGYKNGIKPEEISDIKNLCLTKRVINGKKGVLNEENFKLIFH